MLYEVITEKTRVKAEFFQQQDKVRELAMNFNKEANELAKLRLNRRLVARRRDLGELV